MRKLNTTDAGRFRVPNNPSNPLLQRFLPLHNRSSPQKLGIRVMWARSGRRTVLSPIGYQSGRANSPQFSPRKRKYTNWEKISEADFLANYPLLVLLHATSPPSHNKSAVWLQDLLRLSWLLHDDLILFAECLRKKVWSKDGV